MAEVSRLELEIITPEEVFLKTQASMVEFNTTEGEIGIYPGHIPLTVIVAPGVLRIHEGNEVRQAELVSGFAEILQEKVTILAEEISWKENT